MPAYDRYFSILEEDLVGIHLLVEYWTFSYEFYKMSLHLNF
jgi:hypothetical protein